MPECHTCRWNGKRSKRCLTCKGPGQTSHHGASHVSFDAPSIPRGNYSPVDGGLRQNMPEREAVLQHVCIPTAEEDTVLSQVQAAFSWAMRCWLQLEPQTRRLVAERMLDPSQPLCRTAARMGITPQSAHAKLKRAREQWPALKLVIPMQLLSDGKRRRQHARD